MIWTKDTKRNQWCQITSLIDLEAKKQRTSQTSTCCLKLIFSLADLFAKLDRNDKGNTKAALPAMTSASSMELTIIDVPGLQIGAQTQCHKNKSCC